jgi:dihydroxyacetone kinase-like protein
MSLDKSALVGAIERLDCSMQEQFDLLNEADGKLGDGDLGITLTRGMGYLTEIVDEFPDDLGMSMLKCSQAFTKSSGSSYGTLMAIGMMAIAKTVKGNTEVEVSRVSELVAVARDQIQAKGKAEKGGKTVLDSLDAIVVATAGKTDIEDVKSASVKAVDTALDLFRGKPATMGRARMFGDKSKGLDDPGMLAMKYIVYAIAGYAC